MTRAGKIIYWLCTLFAIALAAFVLVFYVFTFTDRLPAASRDQTVSVVALVVTAFVIYLFGRLCRYLTRRYS